MRNEGKKMQCVQVLPMSGISGENICQKEFGEVLIRRVSNQTKIKEIRTRREWTDGGENRPCSHFYYYYYLSVQKKLCKSSSSHPLLPLLAQTMPINLKAWAKEVPQDYSIVPGGEEDDDVTAVHVYIVKKKLKPAEQ